MTTPRPLRLAFGCRWAPDLQGTWSGTPWTLRAALREQAQVTDAGVRIPSAARLALRAASVRPHAGGLGSTWEFSPVTYAYVERSLRRGVEKAAREGRCQAAVTIHDMGVPPVPYFPYHDLSCDEWLTAIEDVGERAVLLNISPARLTRLMLQRRERQLEIFQQAAGVIAMSRWLADSLVTRNGLPADKVHVVHPPIPWRSAPPRPGKQAVRSADPGNRRLHRARLLFVGRDFYRKGGDLVVRALSRLRRDYDPHTTLTVAGPRTWPLPGEPPPGVRFVGEIAHDELVPLYDEHDLFVMPSRFEPFGLVFAEALARGLPCVARDAYAMPEIVVPGRGGLLTSSDDPDDLSATIAAGLSDDALHAACRAAAPEVAAYFSPRRAASDFLSVIGAALGEDPAPLPAPAHASTHHH